MAEYICKLGTSSGRVIEKVFQADDEKALRKDLDDKDYHVFSIQKKGALSLAGIQRLIRGRKKIKTNDFLIFNQEFMALIKAGMPILPSLSLLAQRAKDPAFKKILLDIRDDVESGASLSEAFETQGRFSRVYTASLMAGERSGELVGVIRRYIEYLKVIMGIRRKVVSALVYPILLVLLSIGLVSVMLLYVIPNFQTLYDDFDAELPGITLLLLAVSTFLKHNFIYVIGVLVIGAVALRFYDGTPAGGVRIDGLKMKLPIFGDILQKYAISQLTRTLATVLGGGIPLVVSLDVAAKAVGNRLISREVGHVARQVSEGQGLADSLERTRLFTDMTIEMVKVGEASGALTEMLSNVSDFYDEEIQNRVSTLMSMLEPVLLIFMGLVIAGMLLAMYLPLFEAINAVRG